MDNRWYQPGDGLNNYQRIKKVMKEQAAKETQQETPQEAPKPKKKSIFDGLTHEQSLELVKRVRDGDEDVFNLLTEEDEAPKDSRRAEEQQQQFLLQQYHRELEAMRLNGGTTPWKVKELKQQYRDLGLKI